MNLNRIFDGLMSSGLAGGLAGGAASTLAIHGLTSKKGRKMAGTAAKLGGAAVVGGLAWKAYDQYRRNRSTATPGSAEGARDRRWQGMSEGQFMAKAPAAAARRDLLVLRAMITAAHADGHVDAEERMRVYERIEGLELSHAEKGLLLEEISSPYGLDQLVQQVPNRAMAAEVYMAALLMLPDASPAHRLFLQDLAEQLTLPAEFVRSMNEEAGVQARGVEGHAPALNADPRQRSLTVSPQA